MIVARSAFCLITGELTWLSRAHEGVCVCVCVCECVCVCVCMHRICVRITISHLRHLAVVCDSDTVSHDSHIASLVEYMSKHGDVRTAEAYVDTVVRDYSKARAQDDGQLLTFFLWFATVTCS